MKRIGTMIMLAVFLLPFSVMAGNTGIDGFNASFYRGMVDGTGGFNVPTSNTLGRYSYHLGLDLDYSMKPLTIVNPARGANTDILKNQIMLNLGGALGLTDDLMAAVTVPVAVYQGGEECLNANCSQVTNYSGQAFGNIMLGLKWRFLKEPAFPVGMAVFGIMDIPTGGRKNFLGDGKLGGELGLALDRRFKKWEMGISSSYRFINKTQIFRSDYSDYLTFGGRLAWNAHSRVRLVAEAKASLMPSRLNSETTEAEFLAGLEFRFGGRKDASGFKAHVLGGRRIGNGFGAPDLRLVAGAGWTSKGKPKEMMTKPEEKPVLAHVVYFLFNQHDMTPHKQLLLKKVVERLRDDLPGRIVIEGHADLWGEMAHNEELSGQRAATVSDYLAGHGIPSSIIEVRHFGSSRPVHQDMTFRGQQKNRRAEIYIYPRSGS